MKNWRKKIQNLFSLKRDSQTHEAYDGVIMTGRERNRLTSQHRRLPPTPHSMTSSKTVRQKAESRIPLHQHTSDKVLNRNEYVEMKQKSQENLHEIGAKHSSSLKGGNCMNVKSKNALKQASSTDNYRSIAKTTEKSQATINDTLFVPEILISHVENDGRDDLMYTSRNVYVCGNFDNDMWHRLLVDLCREFSVRCISPSEYPECNRWLSKTDVFVFLMDDISVLEPAYKDQLHLAIMLNLDVVYVRDLGFELKMEENWHGSLESENEKDISKLDQADSNLTAANRPKLQAGSSNADEGHTRAGQNIDNQGDIYLGLVGSNIVINQDNLPERKTDEDKSSNKSDFLSNNTFRRAFLAEDNHKYYPGGEIDINKVIESEYGTSLVYHDLYHIKCLERIISTIKCHGANLPIGATSQSHSRHSLMSDAISFGHSSRSVSCNELSLNGTSRYLHTPALSMYSNVSNDSALGDMFQQMSPEPNTKEAEEHLSHERPQSPEDLTLPSGSSSTSETIYIVSPDSGNDNLKIFHWPKDVEKEAIANSPSIDSFGFQDIDLSKQVNEIDLFDGNVTD